MIKNKKSSMEIFENPNYKKSVWTLSIPTISMMLVTVFYNLVDTFFIGQTNDEIQVAAVSFAMPLFLILIALGNLFGIGGSVVISNALGAKDFDKAKKVSSFCLYFSFIVGIAWGAISLFIMPLIVTLSGSTTDAAPYVSSYLSYMAFAAPFIIASNTTSSIIRSEGAAKQAMIGMIAGTIVNIVLDPFFILYLEMGITGAAIATVLGNVVTFLYYINYMLRKTQLLSAKFSDFSFKKAILIPIFAIGIPSSISNLLTSGSQIIYNVYLAQYGDVAVAAMGITSKCSMLIFMAILGLTLGIQPLIGYSYGAKNYTRLKEIIYYALKIATIFGIITTIVFLIAGEYIVAGFIDSTDIVDIGTTMLRIQILTGPLFGLIFIPMSFLQSIGKPKVALLLSACRQGIIFIPVVVLTDLLGGGLPLLMWAQPIADIITVVIAIFVMKKEMDRINSLIIE